ncbi:MAG TPA: carboxymuconolactone decarboxylase family protein [Paucimonas sp.]|nr:carboxymuconolactone decarboxylase family protein [Paucimonas sp.]
MDQLTPRERELVALGAAMGSNCVPCIEHHILEARKAELSDGQIREAIELADKVRQVPAWNVLAASTQALDCASGEKTNFSVPKP